MSKTKYPCSDEIIDQCCPNCGDIEFWNIEDDEPLIVECWFCKLVYRQDPPEIREARTALLGAAPELLKACREAYYYLSIVKTPTKTALQLQTILSKAIAKAKGA